MFSGLTNQVSSWMGSSKNETEEKIPTPTGDPNIATTPEKKEQSPTKPSKLDMLSNVKSQIGGIGGWLGSSIPKLRKNEDPENQEDQQPLGEEGASSGAGDLTKSTPPLKDEDDNSSATGGADSGPQSAAESPTEEKEGQFGNVQSKALAGAKSFGNFLYTAVNKAGKTVSEASAKIKKTVEENSILGEFNKEQEAFLKSQQGNSSASALPPWAGCPNEEALKEECLTLSTDRRNFVRSPPAGVDFNFDYEVSYPIAMAIMEQDPNLEKMRYELVPKMINEENFWRNYFYRVTLICQANDVSYMSRDVDSQLSAGEPLDKQSKVSESHEFVSDTLQASSQDIVEVEEEMKKLALGAKNTEEEWEKELEAELQEYEMVGDGDQKVTSKSENWDREIEDLMEDESLK